MAGFKVGFKKPNITAIVVKIVGTVLALWVGGEIMTQIGATMLGTDSAFFTGFTLIGWTVGATTNASAQNCLTDSGGGLAFNNCITAVNGTGVLGVIGLIGIASIILEFVRFRM